MTSEGLFYRPTAISATPTSLAFFSKKPPRKEKNFRRNIKKERPRLVQISRTCHRLSKIYETRAQPIVSRSSFIISFVFLFVLSFVFISTPSFSQSTEPGEALINTSIRTDAFPSSRGTNLHANAHAMSKCGGGRRCGCVGGCVVVWCGFG